MVSVFALKESRDIVAFFQCLSARVGRAGHSGTAGTGMLRSQMKMVLHRLLHSLKAHQRLFWHELSQTLQAVLWVPRHQMNLVPCFSKQHRLSSVCLPRFLFILVVTSEILTNWMLFSYPGSSVHVTVLRQL